MFGFVRRWIARGRLGRSVHVWHHPDYAPTALKMTARATSIDVGRGTRVIEALMQEGLLREQDIRRPALATVPDLARFHSLPYLESTNQPEVLGRIFGLEPAEIDVQGLLQASLRATGGTIAASRAVVNRPGHRAFNLGGGFHHAMADMGAGFCVHNDVVVAIEALRARGFRGRVLIIDLDYHQGDGFIETFTYDPLVSVYSIHGSVWSHIESSHHQFHLPGQVGDRRYLACLRQTLPSVIEAHRPDLIYYVAGTDVLAGDALGTFDVTLVGLLQRDRFVLDLAQLREIPVVAVMAGGYGRDSWRGTYALLRYALTDEAKVLAPKRPSLRRRFSAVAASLDPSELQQEGDPWVITEEDISGSLFGGAGEQRFLDYYSAHGIELALTRYGMFDALGKRGFEGLAIELDTSDRARQVLRVRGNRGPARDLVLIELVVRRRWIPNPAVPSKRVEVLGIEWLLMQDPTRHFTLSRPPLPGQEHPGLGEARQLQEMLIQAALRLGLRALLNNPAYFHMAAGNPGYFFIDPVEEGRFRALGRVLDASVGEISQAIDERRAVWGDGEVVVWPAGARLLPIAPDLIEWFQGPMYQEAVESACAEAEQRGVSIKQAEGFAAVSSASG